MTAGEDVRSALAEIAKQPAAQWKSLLEHRFPDQPAVVDQGLLWLHADRQSAPDESVRPSLGAEGDARYELRLMLASGATASVWDGYDRKLGRRVALKVFHVGEGGEVELAEARAACDVISDYAVRVLDVYENEARPFIVMELVAEHDAERDELTLGAAASSCRPTSVREAATWIRDVARGVRDAHLRNVFHRDLKPANVLITPISRRARIADFGIALSASSYGRSPALVKQGRAGPVSIAGTAEYMSPEQARGLPAQLDPLRADERATLVAQDVWGLGALGYALLAGRPPWQCRDGDEPWEVAASGAAPPPLRGALRGERVPRRLRRIIARAMALDPGARYASAGQVASDLDSFLAARPTTFDRSSTSRVALWFARNPQLGATGLAAIVLAVITLLTYISVRHLRTRSDILTQRVEQQQSEENAVKTRAAATRAELAKTEAQLKSEGQQLVGLEGTLRDEQKTYETLLTAKDKALHDANAATRALVGELSTARSERRTAEAGRADTQQLLEASRGEADQLKLERDQAQRERDSARLERDRARAANAQAAQEVARLSAALDAANTKLAASVASAGSNATSASPPVAGSNAKPGTTGSDPAAADAGVAATALDARATPTKP